MPTARLVYLYTRFPWPLDRGDRLRAYSLIREFSRLARVTLVAFTDGPATAVDLEPLNRYCERIEVLSRPPRESWAGVIRGLPRREPLQVAYYRSAAMTELCRRLAGEKYDVAFAQMFRMMPYLDFFRSSRRVLDLGDSLALNLARATPLKPWYVRPLLRLEAGRVESYERRSMRSVDESWVVAEVDRQDLVRREPGARVEVIPNGLVLGWGEAGLEGPKESEAIFLGNMTVHHNLDTIRYLAREVWPLVRRGIPAARLRLVGLADRRARALGELPGVIVDGFQPDLAPLFRRARVALAPLRYGSGLQNKVLESMAAGLPAVVTPLVNAPIGAGPGREIVVAERTEEIATAILGLMTNEARALEIGRAGLHFVRSRFSWEVAGQRLQRLLES